jgi:DnaK suppressor protein
VRAEMLAEMRAELQQQRRLVLESALGADAELAGLRESPPGAEIEEGARHLADEATLERLEEAERLELRRIDAALARMDAGSFGTCADCGEEIEPRRLRAVPWATRCAGCAEATENVATR